MYSAASGGHKVLRHAPASGIKRTFDKGGVGIYILIRRPRAEGLFQKILPYKQTACRFLYPAAEKYLSLSHASR